MSKDLTPMPDMKNADDLRDMLRASQETNRLLVDAMQRIADGLNRKAPSLDEQIEASRVVDIRPEIKTISVTIATEEGAGFVAVCQQMRSKLVVVRLEEYREPVDIEQRYYDATTQAPIDKGNGQRTLPFKQWTYENYLKADLQRFVGKAIPANYLPLPTKAEAAAE
jgi:hypothetical protein